MTNVRLMPVIDSMCITSVRVQHLLSPSTVAPVMWYLGVDSKIRLRLSCIVRRLACFKRGTSSVTVFGSPVVTQSGAFQHGTCKYFDVLALPYTELATARLPGSDNMASQKLVQWLFSRWTFPRSGFTAAGANQNISDSSGRNHGYDSAHRISRKKTGLFAGHAARVQRTNRCRNNTC